MSASSNNEATITYITGFIFRIIVYNVLSCQPRVTVKSCFVYKIIRELESIDHLCINPIRRIGG